MPAKPPQVVAQRHRVEQPRSRSRQRSPVARTVPAREHAHAQSRKSCRLSITRATSAKISIQCSGSPSNPLLYEAAGTVGTVSGNGPGQISRNVPPKVFGRAALRPSVSREETEMARRWTVRPAGSNWGDFGDDDELGRLNLITPARRLAALREVTSGTSSRFRSLLISLVLALFLRSDSRHALPRQLGTILSSKPCSARKTRSIGRKSREPREPGDEKPKCHSRGDRHRRLHRRRESQRDLLPKTLPAPASAFLRTTAIGASSPAALLSGRSSRGPPRKPLPPSYSNSAG
jgi:hypothetical protein